jgi:hypothetical protein
MIAHVVVLFGGLLLPISDQPPNDISFFYIEAKDGKPSFFCRSKIDVDDLARLEIDWPAYTYQSGAWCTEDELVLNGAGDIGAMTIYDVEVWGGGNEHNIQQ